MLLDKPTILTGLVQYQTDAIVSSTLIKKQQGTVTLFAFSNGQALSEHTAPYDALVQILDGHMEIKIDDVRHLLHANESILLPASIPHALQAKENTKILLTMIKAE